MKNIKLKISYKALFAACALSAFVCVDGMEPRDNGASGSKAFSHTRGTKRIDPRGFHRAPNRSTQPTPAPQQAVQQPNMTPAPAAQPTSAPGGTGLDKPLDISSEEYNRRFESILRNGSCKDLQMFWFYGNPKEDAQKEKILAAFNGSPLRGHVLVKLAADCEWEKVSEAGAELIVDNAKKRRVEIEELLAYGAPIDTTGIKMCENDPLKLLVMHEEEYKAEIENIKTFKEMREGLEEYVKNLPIIDSFFEDSPFSLECQIYSLKDCANETEISKKLHSFSHIGLQQNVATTEYALYGSPHGKFKYLNKRDLKVMFRGVGLEYSEWAEAVATTSGYVLYYGGTPKKQKNVVLSKEKEQSLDSLKTCGEETPAIYELYGSAYFITRAKYPEASRA